MNFSPEKMVLLFILSKLRKLNVLADMFLMYSLKNPHILKNVFTSVVFRGRGRFKMAFTHLSDG